MLDKDDIEILLLFEVVFIFEDGNCELVKNFEFVD